MIDRPTLKQFGDLRSTDFEEHPVWIACHVDDYDEPWYDDTDEETFRPYTGALPVSRSNEMLLVSATARLPDGTELLGFLTPAIDASLASAQPYAFVGIDAFGFWRGIVGIHEDHRDAFHRAVGKRDGEVFPILFTAAPNLTSETVSVEVDGWSPT